MNPEQKLLEKLLEKLPPPPLDCYEASDFLGIPVEDAARLLRENWEFVGYNDCGEYEYAPPIPPQSRRVEAYGPEWPPE